MDKYNEYSIIQDLFVPADGSGRKLTVNIDKLSYKNLKRIFDHTLEQKKKDLLES